MTSIRLTICGEGPNDEALVPIVARLVERHLPAVPVEREWADWRLKHDPRPTTLAEKIAAAIELFPCDLLAVHQDADRLDRVARASQITTAVAGLDSDVPFICVVPVRTLEAWLLCDELAIRHAAGNPNGRAKLDLPLHRQIERLADPKARLRAALTAAGDQRRRRQQNVGASDVYKRLADRIEDIAPLLQLSAFATLEAEVKTFAELWTAANPPDGAA